MPECVVCGEMGRDFAGTPRTERLVFLHRALWDLHRLRQVTQDASAVVADEVSDIIRRVERLAELAIDLDPNG